MSNLDRLSLCRTRSFLNLEAVLLLFLAATVGWGEESKSLPANQPGPLDKPGVLALSSNPTTEELYRARVFDEPLVPVGGAPTAEENAALAAALVGYAQRSGPDDFSSLTRFLDTHATSSWNAVLLTGLGLEYYNTAHYSLALDAWSKAWALAKDAPDVAGKLIGDRAAGELAYMYARLGRMTELENLLKSVDGRVFIGSATEKITGAREGLWSMQHRPEVSFRCGPLALHRIRLATDPEHDITDVIIQSASTQQGFSLAQVAELSRKVGLNYQMAFRAINESVKSESVSSLTDFVVPSVVHWRVGHYAALVRREGDRYLLEDPTFGNRVWATKAALESETSGYFLIPPGPLPHGWRAVDAREGSSVWGKGTASSVDPGVFGCRDSQSSGGCQGGGCPDAGMAVSTVHLMLVSLSIKDQPVGYSPPVGPAVRFTACYNQRDAFQPANFSYSNFGPKWTCNWISYIRDSPQSPSDDVQFYARGGGMRTFTGFNAGSQSFAFELYDQTLLTRTGTNSYEMLWPDGSKLVFSQSDGSIGSSRKVFLTQVQDPAGNSVNLTYDNNLRLVALTDTIGQVTTLSYSNANDAYKITQVTDPFGRFATFDYTTLKIPIGGTTNTTNILALGKITDVIGLSSQFHYEALLNSNGVLTNSDFIVSLTTPYGTTSFNKSDGPINGLYRALETLYPDGSRDRVEFNQDTGTGVPNSDPPGALPTGMSTFNSYLYGRNSFYWSRNACATSYRDFSKARIYHWLHSADLSGCSGIIESTKQPLEGRVWYDYGPFNDRVGTNSRPVHIGRVLDDGQTQLYTYAYNAIGRVARTVDPVGRTLSYSYASNGIDLVEVRQTRAGNNELLFRATYDGRHRPLTAVDAAGQTNVFAYNSRGQLLTATDPKGETITYTYDPNGYLIAVDGPLPGTNDVVMSTYDAFGRVQTLTDASGYTLSFDYDTMDRPTKITHPDSTFYQFTYDRLDLVTFRDRAGRQTLFEHDNMRQVTRKTDPLGRVTLFDWCRCGALKSLTDPLGRSTTWLTDVEQRPIGKQYADGSQARYIYESASGRLRQVIDEKQQVTEFFYNHDDTVKSISYANSSIQTPGISFTYDTNYQRVLSMTDASGTRSYAYVPVTDPPTLGAGQLAAVDGPLPNDTITYGYDELGRTIHRAIGGVDSVVAYDAMGRIVAATNVLGGFTYTYDGSSGRLLSKSSPNGLSEALSYSGNLQDFRLQQIAHSAGATPISQFNYGWDVPRRRIATWSQQLGAQPPDMYSFGYDAADQLLSAVVTNSGGFFNVYSYAYDPAGNRLSEQVSAHTDTTSYNSLNEISTTSAPGAARTNEWDANDRLVAVTSGNQRTEFTYDGLSRLVAIRQLVDGSEVSLRRFVWYDGSICEERDASGVVTKRFFAQGMKLETGTNAGSYFYTRDHLGSIRELTDIGGNVRARYAYDPYGRRAKLTGDLEADFGFAGMFWAAEANLALTHFRAYDPGLGRWLSRDPLRRAEEAQGPNLYSYVRNEPIRRTDPLGLACAGTLCKCVLQPGLCTALGMAVGKTIQTAAPELEVSGPPLENAAMACSEGFAGAAQALAPAVEAAAPELEGALPAIEAEAPEVAAVAPRIAQVYQAVQPQLYAGVRIPSWFSDPAYLQNVERIGWVARMLDLWRDYVSEEDWPDFVNAMEQQATAIFGGQ